jgi:hypothetical protein
VTGRRGWWLLATASAIIALSPSAAWGEAAESASATDAAANGSSADQAGASAVPEVPVLRPQEELLLQVRTDKWILDQAFSGYSTSTGAYLPLGAFARLLDFAIMVDGDSGRAEGWYLDPENRFRIDVNAGFVETNAGRVPLKSGDAIAALGDIYVRPALLSHWFPLEANVDLPKQRVELKLLAKFPFEEKIERAETRQTLGFKAVKRIEYPREETIYRMMSTPALDVNIRATAGSGQETTSQYDIRASGDFAFMNADLFVGGDRKQAVNDVRFVLRRRDPDGDMLGPLGLTLIELGDTSSIPLPIGVRSRTGRGFVFGNIPIDRGSVFERIDLRGELPIGYEVELYRNDVLIGSVDHPVDGRYEFPQVPLEYGLNVLRLVFYGPHGERREEVRQINAGEERLPKGEFQFAASAVQQDENLIPIHREEVGNEIIGKGKVRAAASAQYGLTTGITLFGGVASFVADDKRKVQGIAGIRTSLAGSALQLNAAYQGKNAAALQLGLAGRFLGASYVLQHSEYRGDFVDELRSAAAGTYRRYTQLRLDRAFRLGSRMLATNLVAERAQRADSTEFNATFRASTSFDRWLVSNSVNYHRLDGRTSSSESFEGAFEVNGVLLDWGVRAGIDYDLRPGTRLRNLNVAIDHDLGAGAVIRATLTHQLSEARATRVGLSLSRRIGAFDLGGDVQYDSESKDVIVGVRASFSFGRGLGGWHFAPPGLARGGSVLALAFRDLDGDGRREEGEPALPGVTFRGGNGEVKTGADGRALVTGLGDGRPAQVSMVAESLPDPYLSPTRAGVEVVPRPGRTHLALFPVTTVSEVEGHAFFRSGDSNSAVSNVQLQLIDSKGEVIGSVKTEYDGYFFLEDSPAGDYHIRIEPDQAKKLGIELAAPVAVKAAASGGLVGDIDVNIVRSSTVAAN